VARDRVQQELAGWLYELAELAGVQRRRERASVPPALVPETPSRSGSPPNVARCARPTRRPWPPRRPQRGKGALGRAGSQRRRRLRPRGSRARDTDRRSSRASRGSTRRRGSGRGSGRTASIRRGLPPAGTRTGTSPCGPSNARSRTSATGGSESPENTSSSTRLAASTESSCHSGSPSAAAIVDDGGDLGVEFVRAHGGRRRWPPV